MKSVTKFMITAAFGALMIASPSAAQKEAKAPAASGVQLKLSKAGDKPIRALEAVVTAKDVAGYPAALAAAQAAAQTDQDRYAILSKQYEYGTNTNDLPVRIAAVEGMLASPIMAPERRSEFYLHLASLQAKANNIDQQAAALEKAAALEPANTDILWVLAELRAGQKKIPEALTLADQAIKIQKAAGKAVDRTWYRRPLSYAYNAKLQPQSLKAASELFASSADPKDRKDALMVYRQYGNLDHEGRIDVMRLMRSAKVLDDKDNILSFASSLALRHYPAEAQAVLNEGVAAGRINASDPEIAGLIREVGAKIAEDKAALPGLVSKAQSDANGTLAFRVANGYFGHADYSKAAELYRLSAQKGGPDKDTAQLRLGIALAMAGQNAEAEAALKAVSGNRSALASYWLAWLANRG